jgi:hypothetical protein
MSEKRGNIAVGGSYLGPAVEEQKGAVASGAGSRRGQWCWQPAAGEWRGGARGRRQRGRARAVRRHSSDACARVAAGGGARALRRR